MEFLKYSRDLLKIEDILPFFPDFVLIDDFKEAICSSLEEYNDHIEQLKVPAACLCLYLICCCCFSGENCCIAHPTPRRWR